MRESGVEAPGSSRGLHPSSARKCPKVGSQASEARPFLGSSARWPRTRLTPGPPPGRLGGPSSQQLLFRSSLGPLGAHPPASPSRTRRGGGDQTEVQVLIAAAGAAQFAGRPRLPARAASAPSGPAPRPGPGSTNRRLRPPPPHLRGGARAPPPPPSQRPRPAPPLPRRPEITRLRRLAPHRRGAEAAIWRRTPAPQSRDSRGNGEVRGRGARQTPRPRASGRPERAASPGEAEAATAAALGRPSRSAPCPCGAAAAPWPVISGDFLAEDGRGAGGNAALSSSLAWPESGLGWRASAWTAASYRLGRPAGRGGGVGCGVAGSLLRGALRCCSLFSRWTARVTGLRDWLGPG